jgi:hypothetical protein
VESGALGRPQPQARIRQSQTAAQDGGHAAERIFGDEPGGEDIGDVREDAEPGGR